MSPHATIRRVEVLGYRIREARKDLGLTREQLARAADVNLRGLAAWETGENQPRVENLAKIAEATGKPLEFFIVAQTYDPADIDAVEKVGMLMQRKARRLRKGLPA
jgi:transcriptional regulator with XRE-family HTH domain